MKKRNKFLGALIALVALSGIASVSATYAFWAATVAKPADVDKGDSVAIGEGQAVVTSLTVGDAAGTGTLVPAGRAVAGQVEYVVLTHSVEWKEDTTTLATNHPGTLSAAVVAGSKKIGGDDAHADLVNITIQVGGTAPVDGAVTATPTAEILLAGAAVPVFVKVTLTEPANQAVYNAIKLQTITFDVTFSVAHT